MNKEEPFYPLKVLVCGKCFLAQIDEVKKSDEIFSENYIYFSSFSQSWLNHAKEYAQMAVRRFGLNEESFIVEVAANDGYLLQYFQEKKIPCLGIEPSHSVASAARAKGLEIMGSFFTGHLAADLKEERGGADLMIANNVLAHVPDINDFVSGFRNLLKDEGTATFEFPHLLELIKHNQFDTIYHEHYSYLSLTAVNRIFNANGLKVYDAQRLAVHGGSLRLFVCPGESNRNAENSVSELLDEERCFGLENMATYTAFQKSVEVAGEAFLAFLLNAKREGKTVVGYGAAAKGNTLLNYCGVKTGLLSFIVDRSPYKQGMYTPGGRIPVVAEEELLKTKPDYIVILPWNLKEEIDNQLAYTRQWGCRFVTAVPELEIF